MYNAKLLHLESNTKLIAIAPWPLVWEQRSKQSCSENHSTKGTSLCGVHCPAQAGTPRPCAMAAAANSPPPITTPPLPGVGTGAGAFWGERNAHRHSAERNPSHIRNQCATAHKKNWFI